MGFQGGNDQYVPGTSYKLFKWKFAQLNTVDILLIVKHKDQYLLFAISTKRAIKAIKKNLFLPNKLIRQKLDCRILECAHDNELSNFRSLKRRVDKALPNRMKTYQGVVKSIKEDIGYLK